jgi:hypothetical protein
MRYAHALQTEGEGPEASILLCNFVLLPSLVLKILVPCYTYLAAKMATCIAAQDSVFIANYRGTGYESDMVDIERTKRVALACLLFRGKATGLGKDRARSVHYANEVAEFVRERC